MTFDQFKKKWEGKRHCESIEYGYQCVALAKLYAQEVDGRTLGSFGGSAIKGWTTGSPFKNKSYVKVNYSGKGYPPRGSIVFFSATKDNQWGHVAVVGQSNAESIWVIEQNAVTGNGKGLGGDKISIRNYPYVGARVGNVLGWYTCYQQF